MNKKKKKGTGLAVLFVLLLTLLLGLLIMRTLKDRSAPTSAAQPTEIPSGAEAIPAEPAQGGQSVSSETVAPQQEPPQLSDIPIDYPEEGTAPEVYSPPEEPENSQSEEAAPFAEYTYRGENETPSVPLA